MRLNMALDLPAEPSLSSFCRRSVRLLLEYGDVNGADVDDVEALVHEQFVASILDAGQPPGSRVCVSLTLEAGTVTVNLTMSSGDSLPRFPDGQKSVRLVKVEPTVRADLG